jgi:hypothetical protein
MNDDEEPQDDEEFARRLQQQEDLLAGAGGSGTTYEEFEETIHNAPDIDELQYEVGSIRVERRAAEWSKGA